MKVNHQKSSIPRGEQQVERREQANRSVEVQKKERREFSELLKRRHEPGHEQKQEIREGRAQVRDRESAAQVREGQIGDVEKARGVGEDRPCRQDVQIGLGEAGDFAVGGRDGSPAAESFDVAGGQLEGEVPVGVGESRSVTGASSAGSSAEARAMDQMAGEILRAVQVGEDGQARRVVFLEVQIPGHGDLRVRLRREGGGLEVRIRADNDRLARLVREHSDTLRGRAREKGVEMTSIQVVR